MKNIKRLQIQMDSSPVADNRPISTAASFKPQSPLLAFRPTMKSSDLKAKVCLGQINTPECVRVRPNVNHFSSTLGFNGNCPSFYGKQYAEKFEDFIIGKTNAVDVIKFRNQIVTINPRKLFAKQKSIGIKTIGKLMKMKKEKLLKMRVSLKLDQPQQKCFYSIKQYIKAEDVKPSELKKFLDQYHNVDSEINYLNNHKYQLANSEGDNVKRRRIGQKNNHYKLGLRINASDMQNIGSRQEQNKNSFSVINRTLNAQRAQILIQEKDQDKSISDSSSENSFQKSQTKDKFNDLVQVYHQKIKQKNLFDPNPGSSSSVHQSQKQIMKSMTLLHKKSTNSSIKSIKQLKTEQLVQKKTLVSSSKEAFNFCADNFINLQRLKSEQLNSEDWGDDDKKIHQKTKQELKLQNLLSEDRNKYQNYKQSLTEKMNDIDQILYQKIYKDQKISEVINKKSQEQKQQKKTKNKVSLNLWKQKFSQSSLRINTQQNFSHDNSLVSEHEAHLANYYEQSIVVQSKIIARHENTSKQMHNLQKLEYIKENIERINKHKLYQ